MLRSSDFTYGSCEYCSKYSSCLLLVNADEAFYNQENNPVRRNYFKDSVHICNECRYNRSGRFRTMPIWIAETYMKANTYLKDDTELEFARIFIKLKDDISSIDKVFVVPRKDVPDEFKDSTNVCLNIPHFSSLSYTTWALRTGQSVMNLWGHERERNKFWKSSTTRLLIALGKMQSETDKINIWIRGYGRRLFHINHFVKPPSSHERRKIIVERLIKLEK